MQTRFFSGVQVRTIVRLFTVAVLVVCSLATTTAADITDICIDANAWKVWPPAKVEKLPDGSTCLVLSGTFKNGKERDRLIWDYVSSMDLSQFESVSFEMRVDRPELVGLLGIFFGSGSGWYYKFSNPDATKASTDWKLMTWRFDNFGAQGKPVGWNKANRFRFSMWGALPGPINIRLRNFKGLRTAQPRDLHCNYLPNGSFEFPGPLPYSWGIGHWGMREMPWAANMDLWRQHFSIDKTVARDGQCSLRLVNEDKLPQLKAMSAWFSIPNGSPNGYTLSAWLKSDRDDLPVTLKCGDLSSQVKVGTEWKRAILTGLKPGNQQRVEIKCDGAGTLWVDAVQVQTSGADTAEFHAHENDAATARRENAVDWSHPCRTSEVVAGRETTGPSAGAKVQIDSNGRLLVDGKPYLTHALGLEGVSDIRMLDIAAAAGFNSICIMIMPDTTTGQLKNYLDRCSELGLRMIPWLFQGIAIENFKSHITTLRNHPALLCWDVFDEPGSAATFAEAGQRVKIARELDPNHPAFINHLPRHLTDQKGDIYSADIYPIPNSKPLEAIKGAATMAGAAAPERKPVWMWLQGTGYEYCLQREPTPRELSCMVYGSLIAGARGILWFSQVPLSRGCWAEQRAMCVELERLTPVLSSLESAPAVKCPTPGLMAKSYRIGNEIWVLAVNTQQEPCDASFSMTGVNGNAEVVFEGRQVEAKSAKWDDNFGPYERHVYRFGSN